MEQLDLQKQVEEAAKEMSSIAKALLGIQHSLDQIAPAVSKMQLVLASLEPLGNDISTYVVPRGGCGGRLTPS